MCALSLFHSLMQMVDMTGYSNANGRYDGLSVVIWDEVLGADLWTRVRDDLPLVDEVTPTPAASASAKPTPVIVDKFKTRTADENPCGEIK